jgi:hypothetical protein
MNQEDESTPLLFTARRFEALAQTLSATYAHARPFPHVVIDDFLDPALCSRIAAGFPDEGAIDWIHYDGIYDRKMGSKDVRQLSPELFSILQQFNGAHAIHFLERLTGISGLVGDPWFRGGGFHQTDPGGFLNVHADFNTHEKLQLQRRINLILYLNREGWREEYGGHLELWDPDMKAAQQRIVPIFNRCVIFTTTSNSFHGHPQPLTCPQGWSRRSLAVYYYAAHTSEETYSARHHTLYRKPIKELESLSLIKRSVASGFRSSARLLEAAAMKLTKRASRIECKARDGMTSRK